MDVEKIIAAIRKLASLLKAILPRRKPPANGGDGASGAMLREGIQRDFPHERLRSHGCYFFALLRWAEEIRGRGFGEGNVVSLFDQARAQTMPDPKNPSARIPIITETCFVNDPVRLLNFLAGKQAVRGVRLWTNDWNHPAPKERIFVLREKHPRHGAHFALSIGGKTWDSLPLDGRIPAGFRVLA